VVLVGVGCDHLSSVMSCARVACSFARDVCLVLPWAVSGSSGWTWSLEILLCILWERESRIANSFARSLFKSASSVEKKVSFAWREVPPRPLLPSLFLSVSFDSWSGERRASISDSLVL